MSTLYETIFTRRSVRKYVQNPIETPLLDEIKKYAYDIEQLADKVELEFLTAEELGDDKAPHYVLAYGADTNEARFNAGYTLQKLELFLQSKGLGSLWYGMGKPPKNAKDKYLIMLGFGRTEVPARSGELEYKRLELNKIANVENPVTRAIRLAPSGINYQPWDAEYYDGKVILRLHPRGLLKAMVSKLQKVDLGIAARHAVEALIHGGKTVSAVSPVCSGKDFFAEIYFN